MRRLVRVAAVDDIPVGHGKAVEVDGLTLAVFNGGSGRYHALSGVCPHEDGPLADGVVRDGVAICPWHGFDFDLATGGCRLAPSLAVGVYPVRVAGDDVLVELP